MWYDRVSLPPLKLLGPRFSNVLPLALALALTPVPTILYALSSKSKDYEASIG